MPSITVNIPSIETEGVFFFKEPFNHFVRNKINSEPHTYKLKVVSVIAMRDIIRNDLRDPFSDIYTPAGVLESEYKKDLLDNVPIITLFYKDERGVEKYLRVPLNYISSISLPTSIQYHNKLLLINLNRLPVDFRTDVHFNDILETVRTRLGVDATMKEVSVGDLISLTPDEHQIRETVRKNNVTVHKTLEVRLREITLERDEILRRLQALNISLGN